MSKVNEKKMMLLNHFSRGSAFSKVIPLLLQFMVPLMVNITYKKWHHLCKTVRLQKIKAYTRDDRVQYKYVIIIPEESVKQLGWREGSELKESVREKSLVIDYLSDPVPRIKKPVEPKMSYEEFRDKIKQVLEYSDGLTWSEIRARLKLEQVVPNNKWVRQMEQDIGLLRLKDPRGLIWRLKHV